MAIVTMDALRAALPGQRLLFSKGSITIGIAGTTASLWKAAGIPAPGSNPGTVNGAIPTSATTGALTFTDPGGGAITELARASGAAGSPGTLILYDRLWHNSELDGTLTTSQAFTMPALTRSTSGVGVELWAECYTSLGVTGVTATATYTNSAGTSARTATLALGSTTARFASEAAPFALQAGDVGVQSVQSVILSASTGTAGNWGLTLMKRIAEIPMVVANVAGYLDGFGLGFPQVSDGACLALMEALQSSASGALQGSLNLIQG